MKHTGNFLINKHGNISLTLDTNANVQTCFTRVQKIEAKYLPDSFKHFIKHLIGMKLAYNNIDIKSQNPHHS